jgi:formylmethanofuran dehydrogenase subunit E
MRKQTEKQCFHRRIKKNFPFGRKSKPVMKCKDCGEALSQLKLKETRRSMKRRR